MGTTFGFDVIRNFEIDERFPNIFLEGGLYFETTRHIVKSGVTDWLWGDNEKTAIIPGIGGGILFGGEEDKFRIGWTFTRSKAWGSSC